MLVYEEIGEENPLKFYGKRAGTISSSFENPGLPDENEIPNYAFLIFDVSLHYFNNTPI